jgi:RNA polymerase sigma-70 factor (ECF subfamily)
MADLDITQIVEQVQQDNSKFSLLYPVIEKKVYFWCYTITKNASEAEDLLQEAMLAIHKGLPSLKNAAFFNSWMYRIVTRCCYDYIRTVKKKDNRFLNYDDFSEDYITTVSNTNKETSPKEIYDLNELKDIMSTFISNLPRKQREAITLFYLEEFKINEIADILDCDANNVKARLHKGRKNLENQILEYQEEHNIKLYGVPFLTILSSCLLRQLDTMALKHNYTLHKQYSFGSFMQSMFTLLLSKGVIITIILCLLGSYYLTQQNTTLNEDSTLNTDFMMDEKNGYDWIRSVVYDKNVTRNEVPITFNVNESIDETDIKVLYNTQEISYTYKDHSVIVMAKQNGSYVITVKDETLNVIIKNIDEKAPILTTVESYDTYITLIIKDEYQQIDYYTSYILYHEERYAITSDNKVTGNFIGHMVIVLYTHNGQFIQYELNLK